MYEQGEILIIPFPFSDLSSIKQRPVVVLSNNKDIALSEDIIVCGITSQLKEKNHSITIDNTNLEKGTIPKISNIRVDKLFTVHKESIIKKLAKLNKKTYAHVKKEFMSLV